MVARSSALGRTGRRRLRETRLLVRSSRCRTRAGVSLQQRVGMFNEVRCVRKARQSWLEFARGDGNSPLPPRSMRSSRRVTRLTLADLPDGGFADVFHLAAAHSSHAVSAILFPHSGQTPLTLPIKLYRQLGHIPGRFRQSEKRRNSEYPRQTGIAASRIASNQ